MSIGTRTKQLMTTTLTNPKEHELFERLTSEIVKLLITNNVNVRQAVTILELADTEIRECQLANPVSWGQESVSFLR